ncbi:hypothetical protein [Pseudoduganella lutea]|uniref:Uncharacterized protein n=1 Tax=Pseudoduganella lutea TaxID=321985 RepID=A0A4P6KTQ7_9BURK|nr:hypothetical protein [Pseudoduganella lutea]QBE62064.1 hypothetical protein EWM63_02920 [Pseudoduganella lutea]
MTFQLATLDPAETALLVRRLAGPVLSLSKTYSFDAEAGATFLSLGGQPWRNPADSEPPGHFNLLWRDQAIFISGYCTLVPHGDGTITRFQLSLSVPHVLAGQNDQVTRLVREGLEAFWCGLTPFRSPVDVEISGITYIDEGSASIPASHGEPVKETAHDSREHAAVHFISDKDKQFSPLPIFVTRTTLEQLQDTQPDEKP